MPDHEDPQHPWMTDVLQETYWLYNWMDDEGIRNFNDFRKAVRRPNTVNILEGYSAATTTTSLKPSHAIISGRRTDLSGKVGCAHPDCIISNVKALFGRTWHYFDTVIIDGPLIEDLRRTGFEESLETRIKILLYLRTIGADRYVAFSRKVANYCSQHFRDYAIREELGLDVILDRDFENEVVAKLARESSVHLEKDSSGWSYCVRYGDLPKTWHPYAHSDPSQPPSKEEILRDTFGRYCSYLISDVSASRNLELPLLQPASSSFLEYLKPESDPTDRVVALDLRLPDIGQRSR